MIIYYYNDIWKHERNKHKCMSIVRRILNVNNSIIRLNESDNIIIDNDDDKYDRNIYIISYSCQLRAFHSINIVSELRKSFKNVSYFILNCNNYYLDFNHILHKDDIIIYADANVNGLVDKIHPEITLNSFQRSSLQLKISIYMI